MLFAPFGVFGAMASTIGDKGIGVLANLGKLVLTLYAAQAFFVVFVFGGVIMLVRIPLRRFIKYVREPFLLAFSTASSESALPIALENMERFGVPKHIVAFVLPTGYSFNLDGSTLYLSMAAMFVAQAAGVHVPFGTQLVMLLTLMLTSKGVAGVPRASLVILAGTLATFQPADRGCGGHSGCRYADGYGAHVGQSVGQLPGHRSGRPLGRGGPRDRSCGRRRRSSAGRSRHGVIGRRKPSRVRCRHQKGEWRRAGNGPRGKVLLRRGAGQNPLTGLSPFLIECEKLRRSLPGEFDMDLRAIQIVLTLAEELHFGRSAARLYMSRPALSASLRSGA